MSEIEARRPEAVDDALDRGVSQFRFRPESREILAKNLAHAVAGLLLLIAIWWVLAEIVMYSKGAVFPTPPETFLALWDALLGKEVNGLSIFTHTQASLYRWGIGYVVAVALGLGLGLLLGTTPRLHEVGMAPVHILQMIPGLAWVPVAMLIFGLGETSTMFIIAITALPPIVINSAGGIRQVQETHLRVARMSGKSDAEIFLHVLLPSSALNIINGLRVGLANGWRVLIAAEMVVGVAVGLGYSIYQSRYTLDFTSSFVSIIVICAIGLAIEKLLFASIENSLRNRLGLDQEETA